MTNRKAQISQRCFVAGLAPARGASLLNDLLPVSLFSWRAFAWGGTRCPSRSIDDSRTRRWANRDVRRLHPAYESGLLRPVRMVCAMVSSRLVGRDPFLVAITLPVLLMIDQLKDWIDRYL